MCLAVRFAFLSLLSTASLSCRLIAQEPAPVAPVPTRSVRVVIHDKHGAAQASVTKDQLHLVVDSKPVAIQSLSSDGSQPFLLGLVIDTSKRQEQVLAAEKKPDETFLEDQATRAGNKAFVIHFDKQIELMQDLTADKGLLHNAVEDLSAATEDEHDDSLDSGDSSDDEDGHRPKRAGGSRLYDAIYLASDEILRKPEGRKVIIVISGGIDHGSKESMASAVESAQKTGTPVYSIYVAGEQEPQEKRGQQGGGQRRSGGGGIGWPSGGGGGYPGGGQGGGQTGGGGRGGQKKSEAHEDGKKILLEISKKTGGAMVEAKKKDDIGEMLKLLSQSLQDEYLLTFQPDASSTGDFHRMSVVAQGKDWKVQAPEAYYSTH